MLGEGALVGDKLRLTRLLAKGGMGSVWQAEHLGLDTSVAVKFMSPEAVEHPEAVERFRREATAAAKIKSPHVVQILDHGVTPDRAPYIVMELLEGEDLGKRITRAGALPLPLVVEIMKQACKALSRAHQLGIVHRDVKPENIFLTENDGELLVKVLDFGIAKHVETDPSFSMTTTGVTIGSPYYMSPEQLMSAKGAEPRSDIWSLGVVAYHAITGVVPFEGETMAALCVAINAAEFVKASSRRVGLPPQIDEFLARALSRDVDDRFQSAKEMATAIGRAAQGLSIAPEYLSDPRTSLAPAEESSGLNAVRAPTLLEPDTLSEASSAQSSDADSAANPENMSPAFARTHGVPMRVSAMKRTWVVGAAAGAGLFAFIALIAILTMRSSPDAGATIEGISPSPGAETPTTIPTATAAPTQTATVVPIQPAAAPDAGPAPTTSSKVRTKPNLTKVPVAPPTTTGKKRKDRGF
jgi:serine/threonine-protein kinase